jgi:CRP-like cAMP-binding protein
VLSSLRWKAQQKTSKSAIQQEVTLTCPPKSVILRIAKRREVLGLLAALPGNPDEVIAETVHPCQVVSIHREVFLHFICQKLVKQLTVRY